MKKLFLVLISLNLYAYTLDYPNEMPDLSQTPGWKDPTIPSNLYEDDNSLQNKLNELDEKKLKKLKKALDILFEEDEVQTKATPEEVYIKPEPKPSEYIKISINGEEKPKKNKKPNQNDNILININ